MIELPDRIDMARAYAESVSVQAPGFWQYAESEIRRWRSGHDRLAVRDFDQTQAGKNLRAILRGELRFPS